MATLSTASDSEQRLVLKGGSEPRRRVAYFYDPQIGDFHYAAGHPMKPHRIRMTHSLVMGYGLYNHMGILRAQPASTVEMTRFHSEEYVDYLYRVTPDTIDNFAKERSKFKVGDTDDCPVFDGLFDYCAISAGGSMEGAAALNQNRAQIAVNWAGGLHHAKKSEASGFCYINDIVLAILELLRYHQRVLYIDIDIHHGDGVEEAFYTTDRVMTVSFHKYGEFFPGTGALRDIGHGKGRKYSVNFPLRDGIDDETYQRAFEPVIKRVVEWYRPGAIVLQCGADSLAGDRLGSFNISMRGHGRCVEFVKSLGLPLLLLGGGGYTVRNVSRTWTYETAVAVGAELSRDLPANEYMGYFGPDDVLDVPSAAGEQNHNTPAYLEYVTREILREMQDTTDFAPSVQSVPVPRDAEADRDKGDAEMDDPEQRMPQRIADSCTMHAADMGPD